MAFQSRVMFNERQYPELTKHLESLPSKKRAEKIRALCGAAYMLEVGEWTIVPKGSNVTQFTTVKQEVPSGFGTNFRKSAAL